MNQTSSPLLDLPNTYRAFYGTFSHLTDIQQQTIHPILHGKDVVVQAKTGAGKTEAVLTPSVESLIQSQRQKAILYIVPTRALAVDLERRLIPILERLKLGLGIRTGDLKRGQMQRTDVLLTTPESFDVAMGSPNPEMRQFLRRVAIVIIDEVHPLVHSYRGKQLAYLLCRLELRSHRTLQKIAISATIASIEEVLLFFRFRSDADLITSSVQRPIVPYLVHLIQEDQELVALLNDFYDSWHYQKVLIFANSRGACDRLYGILNQQGSFQNTCELHYSNLKPKERRDAETRFRQRQKSLCIATSTLELGIDIGDVDVVMLYEPPDSVSAFLQRIGRANRREAQVRFWGICRGEFAQRQLLQFLGLLRLAQQSTIEVPPPKSLPSVLVQQILSCLYEKKQISLPSLEQLFPHQKADLGVLFPFMAKLRWLRKAQVEGLYRASVRYRESYLDRKIWSNFPETEEDYVLELSGEAIADLPASIIKQLEVGDRVQLAGKRIQILQIDRGQFKRVLAQETKALDNKEIFWLGSGFQVSYEVAQSIQYLLKYPEFLEGDEVLKLFKRPQKLWNAEQQQQKRIVTLGNGIEVYRLGNGMYRYQTFLGSLGNTLLQWTIQHHLAGIDNGYVVADAIGLECTHFIDFQTLPLPTNKYDFSIWARQNRQILCAFFPLNAFYTSLPLDLLVKELTDFIYDPRLAEAFQRYQEATSDIVEGDAALLEWQMSAPETETDSTWLPSPISQESLLVQEKERWLSRWKKEAPPENSFYPRALTGTLIGDYFRHDQCERQFRYAFLKTEHRTVKKAYDLEKNQQARIEQGKAHERQTLQFLKDRGEVLWVIAESDTQGKRLSLEKRFENSLNQIQTALQEVRSGKHQTIWLAQVVLILPSLFARSALPFKKVNGIGIPDLIRVSYDAPHEILAVGDIKGSVTTRYDQKWQVAFYAFLFKQMIDKGLLPSSVKVSEMAFLLTRNPQSPFEPEQHAFELGAYEGSTSALLGNLQHLLSLPPAQTRFFLQPSCVSCPNFEGCYWEALLQKECWLLPQMTFGQLAKFDQCQLATMETAHIWFENQKEAAEKDEIFSPSERDHWWHQLKAFQHNQIGVKQKKTRLFPANIVTGIFFQIVEDPVSLVPKGIAWLVWNQHNNTEASQVHVMLSESKMTVIFQRFVHSLSSLWESAKHSSRGPHLFYFGTSQWHLLKTWIPDLAWLWESGKSYATDLKAILKQHFYLPIPGQLTLSDLIQLLQLRPPLPVPESLWHSDRSPWDTLGNEDASGGLEESVKSFLQDQVGLQKQVWQWVSHHLASEWEQHWESTTDSPSLKAVFETFITEERSLQEESILSLQALPLEERIARFRAIGPLKLIGSELDEEGHFLYHLQTEGNVLPSKFREGDFLKLAPLGLTDIQSGVSVILMEYNRTSGFLKIRLRRGKGTLAPQVGYSLEEDATDWNTPKLSQIIDVIFSEERPHWLASWFENQFEVMQSEEGLQQGKAWLAKYQSSAGLNATQCQALLLPFQYDLSMIEGPPGTGKTHLLGWILIALIQNAVKQDRPLHIHVSALTHQAIDNILQKVVNLINHHQLHDFPAKCFKWGKWDTEEPNALFQVEVLNDSDELAQHPYYILGSTGFGVYQLFEGKTGGFPPVFDWVIFDEASQVLIPQALLSLVYGKANFLFLGDVQQLPPIVLGRYSEDSPETIMAQQSILAFLLEHHQGPNRVRLNVTYRMNQDICEFPSRLWYDSQLVPDPGNTSPYLELMGFQESAPYGDILSPERPMTLVLLEHQNCLQKSESEAKLAATLAHEFMVGYGLDAEQIALIAPHRAQNNAIAEHLVHQFGKDEQALPVIDTVERIQGAERDVILFCVTTSDLDHIDGEFLNNPNRFNVVITRAKKKLIVIGSQIFFSHIARTETALIAHHPFKAFYDHCQDHGNVVYR